MEKWKDIRWYEWLYQVSDQWRVKSFRRKERILKLSTCRWWYKRIKLCVDYKSKEYWVHRLVLWTFERECPEWQECNHKNGIKDDNRLVNLEWCTKSDNIKHSLRVLWHKTNFETNNPRPWKGKFGKDNHSSKKILQYTLEWEFIREWHSARDVSRELNINYNWII